MSTGQGLPGAVSSVPATQSLHERPVCGTGGAVPQRWARPALTCRLSPNTSLPADTSQGFPLYFFICISNSGVKAPHMDLVSSTDLQDQGSFEAEGPNTNFSKRCSQAMSEEAGNDASNLEDPCNPDLS